MVPYELKHQELLADCQKKYRTLFDMPAIYKKRKTKVDELYIAFMIVHDFTESRASVVFKPQAGNVLFYTMPVEDFMMEFEYVRQAPIFAPI